MNPGNGASIALNSFDLKVGDEVIRSTARADNPDLGRHGTILAFADWSLGSVVATLRDPDGVEWKCNAHQLTKAPLTAEIRVTTKNGVGKATAARPGGHAR